MPLVIEASASSGAGYRELARRTRSLSSFRASFAPLSARYVRIRALRPTFLHFERVTVR